MTKLENFVSIKAKSELKKYIDSYYFHNCNDPKSHLKYTYYPHIKHAVTIYKDSNARTSGTLTKVKPQKSTFSVLYSTVRDQPHQVEIKGKFKKVGIIFKPFGLNHFIKRAMLEINTQTISNFEEWSPKFHEIADRMWQTEDITEKVSILESFLNVQRINNFNKQFIKIIHEIMQSESVENISTIAKRNNINRRKLYRLFIRELNCSPSHFLKILRFRKSLETYKNSNTHNLTEAAVTNFYDQSDFIKNVKQITSLTPKTLTKETSDLKNSIFFKIE